MKQDSSNNKTTYIAVAVVVSLLLLAIIGGKNNSYSSKNGQSTSEIQNCIGNEGCISSVRENFTNTGKTILGEEYLGNGKFGISMMDPEHAGAFNATVATDCNCNVTNVKVSTIH